LIVGAMNRHAQHDRVQRFAGQALGNLSDWDDFKVDAIKQAHVYCIM